MTGAYIPLLVDFSHEDKAAKGLRSLKDKDAAPQPPVWFTALEAVAMASPVLLSAPRGGGKTAFARDLASRPAARDVPRDDTGTVIAEHWDLSGLRPILIDAGTDPVLATAEAAATREPVLLIVDAVDRLGADGPAVLAGLAALAERHPGTRLVVLGRTGIVSTWPVPTAYARHALKPLLASQRDRFATRAGLTLTPAARSEIAARPDLFLMALAVDGPVASEAALVDAWLAASGIAATPADAFARLRDRGAVDGLPPVAADHLAARHLLTRPAAEAAGLFHADPDRWTDVLTLLAIRCATAGADLGPLVDALIAADGDTALRGALIAADLVGPQAPHRAAIAAALVRMIVEGRLSPPQRGRAGRVLAVWGDPRDLEALVPVPGGTFTFGSDTHPNSAPPAPVTVGDFHIGAYPVTNGLYARFVKATGRLWRSPDGRRPERANAPAVDLTWRDARACCDWLTLEWRAEGRIAADDIVRLPTEPEWERAARGDQPDAGAQIVYPWGGGWDADAANSDETGFNDTCTVGLFPRGRSRFGAYDMAGHVWEWTTTLWGDDMATPSFTYPYADDGREDPDAGPAIRRVLRGGCFSSGRLKANCTYRGSLEPDGFWRGNGFRVVVVRG